MNPTAILLWFEERMGTGPLMQALRHKTVPRHRFWPVYLLGGAALFLLGLDAATGLLLAVYYRPTPQGAHASVVRIVTQVPLGWLVRGLHVWGASALVAVLILHALTVWATRGYRGGREMTWMSGLALAGVVMVICFTGTLLPWTPLSYFASIVGTDVLAPIPLVGPMLLHLARGGDTVSGDTLGRFFVAHTMVLPGLALAIALVHIALVTLHGTSVPPGVQAQDEEPFFPAFVLRDLSLWSLIAGGLVLLAAFCPPDLGIAADPLTPAPAGIHPEWYFLPMFEFLRILPAAVGPIPSPLIVHGTVALAVALFVALPFADRPGRSEGPRRVIDVTLAILVVFAVVLALTYATGHGRA